MLNDSALDQLFREARTHNQWLVEPVTDETLRQLYDLVKWGPTSANSSQARFIFLRSRQSKERLRPGHGRGSLFAALGRGRRPDSLVR